LITARIVQRPVRDRGEVVAEISVDHLDPPMVRDVPEGPANRHFGVLFRAEPELLGQQVRLEDGTQHHQHRHLDHAVADARDAQRALAAVALRDPHAQEGLGPVFAGLELLPQPFQPPLPSRGLDGRERLAVHAGCTAVAAACAVSFRQDIRAADLVPQGVEAEGWFSLSFRLQRGLQPSDPIERSC
jgi:hypothetical protein